MQAPADAPQGDRPPEATEAAEAAFATLRAWRKAGAHRRDLNKRRRRRVQRRRSTLMDAWCRSSSQPSSSRRSARRLFPQTQGMLGFGSYTGGSPTEYPSSPTAGRATSPRTFATSSARSRRRRTAATTAAAARSRSAGRCCSRSLLASAQGHRRRSTAAAGDCASDPHPACWDQDRADANVGYRYPSCSLPEPADVPAGRDVDQKLLGDLGRDTAAFHASAEVRMAEQLPSLVSS